MPSNSFPEDVAPAFWLCSGAVKAIIWLDNVLLNLARGLAGEQRQDGLKYLGHHHLCRLPSRYGCCSDFAHWSWQPCNQIRWTLQVILSLFFAAYHSFPASIRSSVLARLDPYALWRSSSLHYVGLIHCVCNEMLINAALAHLARAGAATGAGGLLNTAAHNDIWRVLLWQQSPLLFPLKLWIFLVEQP